MVSGSDEIEMIDPDEHLSLWYEQYSMACKLGISLDAVRVKYAAANKIRDPFCSELYSQRHGSWNR